MESNEIIDEPVVDDISEDDNIDLDIEEEANNVDTTDYKAEVDKWKAIAQRYKTKATKTATPENTNKTETLKSNKETGDIDYGHLAFFNQNSEVKVKDTEDIDYLKQMVVETGKDQKTLLGSKWFQAEIKERQESRIVREATPSNTRRSTTSAKNTVDYWLAKGELPPSDQTQLRREVLNAKINMEKNGSKFSDQGIVMS